MIKLNLQQIKNSAHLFKGISDTALTSCLEGLMGDVYGESENPKMAIAFLGYIYIGGILDKAFLNEFMNFIGNGHLVFISDNKEIRDEIIKHYGKKAHIQRRFETIKEFPNLPEYSYKLTDGFALKRFDKDLYTQAINENWSDGFCNNFNGCDDFLKNGLGFGITYNDKLVCGATSFSYYSSGYEVIIATNPDFRKRGLARIASYEFIKESLKQGRLPSWDAAHEVSLHLAEWLGYKLDYEYTGISIQA